MIQAAIVGAGWWGKTLVESLAAGSEVMRFVALTTPTISPEVVKFAEHHALRVVPSYEELLADAKIDSIVLATPPSGHAAQVIAAARAGKHVFCEKPFTYNKTDALRTVEAVRAANRVLGLAYNRRFHPEMGHLRGAPYRSNIVAPNAFCVFTRTSAESGSPVVITLSNHNPIRPEVST
jgi:predicted dehydrogenase